MTTRPLSDRPGIGADTEWLCCDPTCAVCWLWRRDGESKADWLARLTAQPDPRYPRGQRV